MNNQEKIKALEEKREAHITKIFWLCIEIALVFLIPALIGVYLSNLLFPNLRFITLAATFIISWTIVIFRYQSISKKMRSIDMEIKELKSQNEPE
jgi:hypothetical protein